MVFRYLNLHSTIYVLNALAAFALAPSHVAAQEATGVPSTATMSVGDVTTVKLGLGALALPDFEGAKHYHVFPVPMVEVENWHRVSLSLRGLSYRLYHYENGAESEFRKVVFQVDPVLSASASRKEDNDFLFFSRGNDRYLRGLGDVDAGLDLGADILLRTGPVRTRLSLRQEVAGGHDGFTAQLGLGTRFPLARATWLGIEAATTWADEDYMDAFFSIDRQQAFRSMYRHYDAGAEFKDASIALKLDHDFTDHISLVGIAQYARLLGDAADSPIVTGRGGSEDQFTALLGLTYKWSFGN